MKNTVKISLGLLLAASAGLLSAQASAQTVSGSVPYLIDSRNVLARSGTGLCWRTGYWTPATAIPECEPDMVKAAPPAAAPAPVAPRAAAPAPVSKKVTLQADALFDFDKSVLKPEGKAKLDKLAADSKGINLEVIIAIGHTDSIGSDAYNQKLSVRRAESVKAYLVSKGIEGNRVYTEGKGEKQPVADNKTKEGRAKNRRVEVEVVGSQK